MANTYNYPPVGFHFRVHFEGLPDVTGNDIRFMEVSGLDVKISTIDWKEGGENRFKYQLPDGVTYSTLRLKRGMITNSGIIKWLRDATESFSIVPLNITVTLLNPNHEPLRAWHIISAYPISWKTSGFDAMKNEIVTEELELYYQYFKIL